MRIVIRMIQFSRKTRCYVPSTSLVVYGKHDTLYDIILCYINNTWNVCVCVCVMCTMRDFLETVYIRSRDIIGIFSQIFLLREFDAFLVNRWIIILSYYYIIMFTTAGE